MNRRTTGLLAGGLLLGTALLFRREVAAAGDSLLAFADLTAADPLTALLSRTSSLDGRVVHYPTPTRELAAALEARSSASDAAAHDALRHLAEARRELGDFPGAENALSRWAAGAPAGGGAAWAEAARWGARYRRWDFARSAAVKALDSPVSGDGFTTERRKLLATERCAWSRQDPAAGDPLALEADRAGRFPDEPGFAEEWIRSLERAGRLREADEAVQKAASLSPARRALLLASLKDARKDGPGALDTLEKSVERAADGVAPELLKAFALHVDRFAPRRPDGWRGALDQRFEARALVLYHGYFQGKGRGDLAADLLQQVDLRHAASLDRSAWLLLARLHASSDAVPEAFRARLAAAKGASADAQVEDLAALVRLALRSGARPLAWGTYNDEPLKWAARVDVHPGFTSGALSFLLTGFDGASALSGLEARRLPERTFRTARLLLDELERRAPSHEAIPALVVEVMERHVQRGEGAEAMKLLPKADRGDRPTRAASRRVALLALRQTKEPLPREVALWKERLRLVAPDGSTPRFQGGEGAADRYPDVLREAISRLDARDRTHRTSLELLLGELDRLPRAEELWVYGAERVDEWPVDADMESRYRAALRNFEGPDWWKRLERWYARHEKAAELKALADEIVRTFRGSELFRRDADLSELVAAEGQPELYLRVADYLRLRALERFPASPVVLREAESRLLTVAQYREHAAAGRTQYRYRGTVDEALLETRRHAVLFQDDARRSGFLDGLVRERRLEAFLLALEQKAEKSPVDSLFLLDGWSRLSRFEQAAPWADRLAEAYPGDGRRAGDAVTLHRSLSGLAPGEAALAARIARAALPAQAEPAALLTQVGEMWEDLDRPAPAEEAFRQILRVRPRNAAGTLEVATDLWDYGHFEAAWKVLAEGRTALGLPRLHAFEAGVLREEMKDLPGALDEYLSAAASTGDDDADRFGSDSRAARRIARLAGRPAARTVLLARIDALKPGDPGSEAAAVRFLSVLAEADDRWAEAEDDWADLPRDPVGREERAARRDAARPTAQTGLATLGSRLQAKVLVMSDRASEPAFLASLRRWKGPLLDPRWTPSPVPAAVDLEARLLAREAELAPTPEARIEAELARARYLSTHGRGADAGRIAAALAQRVDGLPDGPAKIRALVTLARFAEESRGDAGEAWTRVSAKYPWSLGVLDDHLEFLFRTGRDREGLDLLEKRAGSAAAGHRERLTERLVSESLSRSDDARARRGLKSLLALPLEPDRRVAADGLLARVSFRADPSFDAIAFGRAESKQVPEALHADLFNALALSARAEGKPKADLALSIEALNRRLDRDWLVGTARAAAAAGLEGELLRFFEAQRARSPRDVRWPVAVRDIRMYAGDLAGAIESAREACAVAPEQETLQREAVTLFERAGRFRDASDFLAGWAKSRAGDESVASWRSSLLLRAGENSRAVDVERASMAASRAQGEPPGPSDGEEAGMNRLSRVVRRFLDRNRARAAWLLAYPPDGRRDREGPLPDALRAELGLRAGRFQTVFEQSGRDARFLRDSAQVIERLARPEQLAWLQEALLARLVPAGAPPDQAALNLYWQFAGRAGLHRFGEALSRRLLERAGPGPWGQPAPMEFVRSLDPVSTEKGNPNRLVFARAPGQEAWVSFLSGRERLDLLAPALDRMVADLDAEILRPAPASELPFARAFPVEQFARLAALPGHEAWRTKVRAWFSTAPSWNRFLAATGKRWSVAPLLPLLDAPARNAWLRAAAPSASAAEARRADAVLRVSGAVAALVENAPGASKDRDVVRLRGPRTVGALLSGDPAWTFPELAAVRGATGDDQFAGSGADEGRIPARLWGHRPGEAWYVLETLARYRERDAAAPFVPLSSAPRGQEAARALLGSRTAEALGDLTLALTLDGGDAELASSERLERRLRLILAAGADRRAEAAALLGREVVRLQGKADDQAFRRLERIGADLGLGPAADLVAPDKPVSAALLASLVDRYGPARFSHLKPVDAQEFRAAVASRWRRDAGSLSGEKLTWAIENLWTEGTFPFPVAAAARSKAFWPEAATWLAGLDRPVRRRGLPAVRSLPDPAGVAAVVAESAEPGEAAQLLLYRAELSSGRGAAALKRLQSIASGLPGLSRPRPEPALPAPPTAEPADASEDQDAAPAAAVADRGDSASLLRTALRLARAHGDAATAAAAEEFLSGRLRKGQLPGSAAEQRFLALDLAKGKEELDRVLSGLEREWASGEWTSPTDLESLVRQLAPRDEAAAWRWFGRLDEARTLDGARTRASLLVVLKRPDLARGEWADANRLALRRPDELVAFDGWRQLPGAAAAGEAPATWKAAVVFWRKKAADYPAWAGELAAHLAKDPYDRLAARSVLRSLSPASEEAVAPAVAALGSKQDVSSWRIARESAERSPRRAFQELPGTWVNLADLRNRRFPRSEIDGLLRTFARLGASEGQAALVDQSIAALEDLAYAPSADVRAGVARIRRDRSPGPRLVLGDGTAFRPLRPLDLDWDLYAKVLDKEVSR